MNRKTFLLYLLSLPFFGKLFSFSKEGKRYLLNRFSVAGFQFQEGMKLIDKFKVGDQLKMIPEPENIHDESAVRLEYKSNNIGFIPRSDNKHISRLLRQDLSLYCEIFEVNPDEEPWHMCKAEVYLIT